MNQTSTRRRVGALALPFAIALATFGAGIAPAGAAWQAPLALPKPSGAAIGMLDARVNHRSAWIHATDARPAAMQAGTQAAARQSSSIAGAVRALRLSQPALEAKASPLTGGAETVSSRKGALTDPAPGRRSEDIVRGFLRANAAVYGLRTSDLADLHVLGDSAGGASGLRMLRLEQRIDGRPVFQSETRFLLDRDGRLFKSTGQLVPEARARVDAFDAAALMDAREALVELLASVDAIADAASFTVRDGEDGRLLLAGDPAIVEGDVTAREVLFPLAPGVLVPAWSLVAFTPDAAWYAVIDAETGDLLWRKNIREHVSAHDARFRVYVQGDGITPADSPSPRSPTTNNPGDTTQPPEIAPSLVSMHAAMDALASPNGWINDCPAGVCTANESQTLGNNVLACMDRAGTGNNICDTDVAGVIDGNGRPTGNPDVNSRNRDFLGTAPRDFQTGFLPPPQGGNPEAGQTSTGVGASGTNAFDQYRRGALTHMFYVTNWYHDRLFALGFDEASGNFQQTNFSGMGLGNDRVLADGQDGSGTNNANFGTPPDGQSGRMQMFRFIGPTIARDSALDAEIVIHELTHGTTNRLVGNAAGLSWDQGRSMGEGWGDFFAMALLNNTNADDPDGRYASGGYATYKLGTSQQNYLYGIRRFPYSTDNSVNPLTWADIDDVSNDQSGGIAPSPLNFLGNGALSVHNAGEVWALSLWEVRSRIIADPASANGDVPTGTFATLQLVTDGLKMTPSNPTFTEARDALVDADCATNACGFEDEIWAGFADRGLGYGAATPIRWGRAGRASHAGVTESFQLPRLDMVDAATDLQLSDAASNNNGSIDPGEALQLVVRLTNPWRSASKNASGITATLSTATPGVTIHDATSVYPAIAVQGSAVGDGFVFTVAPSVACGSPIEFTLTTTSSLGTTSDTFTYRVGTPSGTGAPITYTGNPNPDLAIPDNSGRGVQHGIVVNDDFVIADLDFRVDSITHPWAGDVTVMLRSPSRTGTDLVGSVGRTAADGGSGDNLTNLRVDDDLPSIAANDMMAAPAANAPYPGPYLPQYNSPSFASAFGIPSGAPQNLAMYDNASTKGTWTVLVADQFLDDIGTFNAWSMIVTPVNYTCSAFAPSPDVTATKTVSGVRRTGNQVTYTVTLANDGTAAQPDIAGDEFIDVLPVGLSLVNASATSGSTVATLATRTVTWNGALAPLGGSVTITIVASIDGGTQNTTLSNQGTLQFDSDGNDVHDTSRVTDDPSTAAPDDATSFAVEGAAFTASKSVAGTFGRGSTVTYTVVLANIGNTASVDVPGADFVDQLPAGVTVTGASASTGTTGIIAVNNVATWSGSVPAGGSVTITITATVDAGATGIVANQGTLVFDANLDNAQDSSVVTDDTSLPGIDDPTPFTVQVVELSASKTVAGSFLPGGAVTYTIVLANAGNFASPDNATDEFVDVVSNDLIVTGVSASSGVIEQSGLTIDWNGSVPAGGSVTLTIQAVSSPTFTGNVSNQGTLFADVDLDDDNDTQILTDDPALPGAVDPTVFVVQGPQIFRNGFE